MVLEKFIQWSSILTLMILSLSPKTIAMLKPSQPIQILSSKTKISRTQELKALPHQTLNLTCFEVDPIIMEMCLLLKNDDKKANQAEDEISRSKSKTRSRKKIDIWNKNLTRMKILICKSLQKLSEIQKMIFTSKKQLDERIKRQLKNRKRLKMKVLSLIMLKSKRRYLKKITL